MAEEEFDKKAYCEECAISFHAYEDLKPVVTLKWHSSIEDGAYQEYCDVTKIDQVFGVNKRFKVTKLSGVSKKGTKIKGQTVSIIIQDTKTKKYYSFSYNSKNPKLYRSLNTYSNDWISKRKEKIANKTKHNK